MATLELDRAAERFDTPEEGLQELLNLLSSSRVESARALVKELAARWPDNEKIGHYAYVLQPPRVLHVPPSRNFRAERAWVRANGRKYPGRWLAIKGDTLIAEAASVKELDAMIEGRHDRDEIMTHFESHPWPRS